jgi:hypothetical protein
LDNDGIEDLDAHADCVAKHAGAGLVVDGEEISKMLVATFRQENSQGTVATFFVNLVMAAGAYGNGRRDDAITATKSREAPAPSTCGKP